MSLYYSGAKRTLNKILKENKMKLPRGFMKNLLSFLSKGYNYSEEGIKYFPEIILTTSFDTIDKIITNTKKIVIKRSFCKYGKDFSNNLKPIIPFCENGWIIYVLIDKDYIEYGIIRSFNEIHGPTFIDDVFDISEYEEDNLLLFKYLNESNLMIKSLLLDDEYISLEFINQFVVNDNIGFLINDCIYDLNREQKNIKKAMQKFFDFSLKQIHGTIIITVSGNGDNLKKEKGLLEDGIWLEAPIDLGDEIVNFIESQENQRSEGFYALSGLLLKMIDFDGITILNSKCQILAYNCFIHEATNDKKKNTGGARNRAFKALCNQKSDINSVYFQSHDGNTSYKKLKRNEEII